MPNNTFVDLGPHAHTITVGGTPTIGSKTPYPQGGAPRNPIVQGGSVYFDGASHLEFPITNAYDYGAGDFTFETWVYVFNLTAQYAVLSGGISIYIDGPNQRLVVDFRSTSNVTSSDNGSLSTIPNRWAHIAVTRTGTTLRIFLDGVIIKQTTASTDFNSPGGSRLGRGQDNGIPMIGYMAGVRSVKGTGLYTENFAVPTGLPQSVTNTKVLLWFDNPEIYCAAGKSNVYINSGVTLHNANKKFGTGSIQFDGTTGFIRMPNVGQLVFGANPFTIETWIYPTTISSNRGIFGLGPSSSSSFGCRINASQSNRLEAWVGGTGNTVLGINSVQLNTWQHVALVRTAGHIKLFLDGNEEFSTTTGLATNINSTTHELVMGRTFSDSSSEYFAGRFDDLRVTKNISRYSSPFTPHTEKHPVL